MDAAEQKQKRVPMLRPGCGSKGQKIRLLTNHFDVKIDNTDYYFFQYSVALYYEDGKPVEVMKGVGRKVMDKIKETYSSELDGKEFAYDGEKTLFTVGSLPRSHLKGRMVRAAREAMRVIKREENAYLKERLLRWRSVMQQKSQLRQ
ncbi:protein argonaute 4-like [Chenopodium quinoa]|uniref:protein argonaute 4-like n=1 Tax=Chenopodium quinoa TaxID=63459 RepID=UPI000B7969DB|nr:protein argonaute 4-like [Chenopodium quinoa]